MKHPIALHELGGIDLVHADRFDPARPIGRPLRVDDPQGMRLPAVFAPPVVPRLAGLEPFGLPQQRAEFAGRLEPVDPPHLIRHAAILRIGIPRGEVAVDAHAQ
jgi:hypothetical protein